MTAPRPHPTFAAALRFWLKLGFISFGGPTGQIAIMHRELVERRRWISEDRFLHALNYCMLLPGPEAQQLATYSGWLLHRTAGGIAAGALFVLPSIFILWGLSFIYAAHGNVPVIAAAFHGFKPAVTAIVAAAVIRIGRRALRNWVMWGLAAAAFAALYYFQAPFPAVVIGAGLAGLAGGRLWPGKFHVIKGHGAAGGAAAGAVIGDDEPPPPHARPSLSRAMRVSCVCLALWWAPVAALLLWRGGADVLVDEAVFFSKAAMITFGGAYAVLPYVAQQAVERYGWLTQAQMIDGLALAETTPGPLIMVVQFVGFLGGWNHPGGLPPLLAGTLGAAITTWVTFLPCFLWIFLGAPYIERLRGIAWLSAALSAITAAVVGVVLNLAVWFGIHVLFPASGGADFFALGLAVAAFAALQWLKLEVVWVVLLGGAAGLARYLLAG
jgi:chromate transporter